MTKTLLLFKPTFRVILTLGRHDISSIYKTLPGEAGFQRISTQVLIHPKYSPEDQWHFDIALIRFKHPVRFDGSVRNICLPKLSQCANFSTYPNNIDNCDSLTTVAGWSLPDPNIPPSI